MKENIETIDDALAVSEERQKWKQAIKDINEEIQLGIRDGDENLVWALDVINKHTKELMQ